MKTFVVAFEKHSGKKGQRKIRARDESEAVSYTHLRAHET